MNEVIVSSILEKTKEGTVTQWNDRIAKIAEQLDLQLCNINWVGTPKEVTMRVVEYAEKMHGSEFDKGKLDFLIAYAKD